MTDFPGFDAGLGPPTLGGLPGFVEQLGRLPPVQYGVGLGVGVVQGLAPGGGLYQPPLEGPPPYELGRGLGLVAAGVVEFFGGGGLATGGTVVCATGVGCLGGAPAAAVGVAAAANGATSVAAGNRVVQNALQQSHSFATRPGASPPAPTVAVGSRPIGDLNARGGVYALRDPTTGRVMRTGQTNDLHSRRLDHAVDYPDLEFRALFRTDVYEELRGLESFADEYYGHPPLNAQNPIYPGNVNADAYHNAAIDFLVRNGVILK